MILPFTLPLLTPALPELILAGGTLALVLVGALRGNRSFGWIVTGALALMVLTILTLLKQPLARVVTFNDAFVIDGFSRFMKVLTLGGAAVSLILATDFLKREKIAKFEYPLLILLATTGMMIMISANDLITLYLGLELQSLALYVLASMHRDNVKSAEAGLKYFVLGALSSGMLLYGASLLYGFAGTVSFTGIAAAVKVHTHLGVIFGLVFVAAGLAFKMSAVPFHMWTPDVYEGAPTPVTAFFASAPKIAAFALSIRVFIDAFEGLEHEWRQILVFMSIASMLLGSFAAIGQNNLKRLMAYSSIANVGFALMGLAVGTPQGIQAVLIYMAIYLVMTLGTFACLLSLRRQDGLAENLSDIAGLSKTQPVLAFCLAMLMFSLAGIPWLAGFFGKFYVFMAAVEAKLVFLAVVGALASVIGAYYYLRLVKVMYFDDPQTDFLPAPVEVRTIMIVATVLVFFFWLAPTTLVTSAAVAAKTLF